MTGALRAGWDRVDLPLDRPLPLAGFAHRAAWGPATDTTAPIRLRTLALRQGERRVAVVVGDLIYWGDDTVARVGAEVSRRCGLPADHLFLSATHTHSAPVPALAYPPGIGVPDPGFVDALCEAAVASVERALSTPTEVTAARGVAAHHLGVDRRAVRDGHPPLALDERVQVVALRHGHEPVATLFHHACHPVINHANITTSEFPGAAMTALEEGGSTEIALYLQGCCGNINPARYDGREFATGDQPEIEAFGRDLATTVATVLDGPLAELSTELTGARTTVALPTAEPPDADTLRRLAADPRDTMTATWAEWLLTHPERASNPATLTVSRLQLSRDLVMVGLSAEPTSPYADAVRARHGDRVLTLGYTNGMTGYLVTAEQLAQGGYECAEAPYWYGMRGPLLPAAEHTALSALLAAAD